MYKEIKQINKSFESQKQFLWKQVECGTISKWQYNQMVINLDTEKEKKLDKVIL